MSEPTAAAAPETSAPPKSRSGPLWIILAAILILCLVTCVFSVRTSQMAKQAMEAAGVSPTGQTQEDDVAIMETTGIRQRYTARDPDTNVPITGYALVFYVLRLDQIMADYADVSRAMFVAFVSPMSSGDGR